MAPSLFARSFCRRRSVSFSDSPGKYICVTMRLTFPMTSKCRCGGRIQFGFAGYAPGLIVLNRYRPSASVVWTAKPSKFGSSGAGFVSLGWV